MAGDNQVHPVIPGNDSIHGCKEYVSFGFSFPVGIFDVTECWLSQVGVSSFSALCLYYVYFAAKVKKC